MHKFHLRTHRNCLPIITIWLWLIQLPLTIQAEEVSFSRDILPILSDRCFHCHGPDETERQAELRLDERASAIADRGGYAIIKPGDAEQSELIERILTEDEDLVMPPLDSHRKPLTEREVQFIRDWINQGAEWGRHWSFEKPVKSAFPQTSSSEKHPVDVFVSQRLEEQGLSLAEMADRRTLIRRVSFDLTGLPPSLEEVETFVNDHSPEAYEQLVDRLLASPHYGERMAMWWLDAARYSDTDGYQQDATRTNWPWRDWVIDAFNRNQSFDEFTIEQFAGDQIPDASPEQILATCFHRNHMTNGEGGRDPEESRVDYVIDRINTTGSVWLGLTLGCCQCHSHKFDPITQHDYYSMYAFFNSIDEDGRAGRSAKPYFEYQSPYVTEVVLQADQLVQQRQQAEQEIRKLAEQEFEIWLQQKLIDVQAGFEPWQILHASELKSVEGTILQQEADGTIQSSGPVLFQDDYKVIAPTTLKRVTGIRLEIFPHVSHTEGKLSRGKSGEFILTDVKLQLRRPGQSQVYDIELSRAIADQQTGAKGRNYGNIKDTLDDDPRNGWTTAGHDPLQPYLGLYTLAEPSEIASDEELIFVMLHRSTTGDANIGRFRVSVTDQAAPALATLDPMPLEQLAAAQPKSLEEIEPELKKRLLNQFLEDHSRYQQVKADWERARKQLAEFKKAAGKLKVMVLAEREEPRKTHVLERGVWDKHGDEVSRAVPDAILAWPEGQTNSRLDLARWIVAEENPLTARVIVNQFWQICFGAGLVRTPDDFGLQGEFPTHPDLLDWLAVEFMESGWDVKQMMKIIVTSQTYRQSSLVTAEEMERDPDNRLLARGPRYRLPSWMIRDAALKTSGLLNPTLGGPPVMPYQPAGVWAEMFMGRFQYQPSQGAAQFRRTVYAFWRRSAGPTFLFDSAQRRVCELRPRRTNTPLHALTLLNDTTYQEASRALAQSVIQQHQLEEMRLNALFAMITKRPPTKLEMQVISRELNRSLDHYQSHTEDARNLLAFGQPELRQTDQPEQLAAYMIVASMILNLDEVITHE